MGKKWRIWHLGAGHTDCDSIEVMPSGALRAMDHNNYKNYPDLVPIKFFAPGGWLRAEQVEVSEQ